MQYIFRGTYNSTLDYNKLDVVVYRSSVNLPKKFFLCLTSHTSATPQTPDENEDTAYWGELNSDSSFPENIDNFITRSTMTANDKTDYDRYQVLFLKSSLTPAEQDEMSLLTDKLRNKILQPQDFNKLQSALQNMQFFLKNEVEGYINQKQQEFQANIDKFTDREEYSSTATYQKNNFVTYQSQTYICTVDNTVNILPTVTTNWRLVARQGDRGLQGESGLNLVYRGTYDPNTTYNAEDAVEYGGSIYYATQTSIGEIPQSNGTSWTIFMPRASILVSSTPPSSPTNNQVWVDTSMNKFKYYTVSNSTWNELNAAAISDGTLTYTPSNIKAIEDNLNEHQADYVKHPAVAIATNVGNDYAVTLNPAPTVYVDGMGIVVTINADSAGAATLNVNGLGAKPIKKANGNDVTNVKVNGVYTVRYNPSANAGTGAFILQGEGGEYGIATPSDVLQGVTFGTENGLATGTFIPTPIKTTQRGSFQHNVLGAMDITITSVDRNKCLLLFSFDVAFDNTQRYVSGEVLNNNTIRFTKHHAEINNVHWRLIELNNVKSRQEISVLSNTNVTDIPITAIDISKSVLVVSWDITTGTNDLSLANFTYDFFNSTTVRISTQRTTVTDKTFKVQVIEFE